MLIKCGDYEYDFGDHYDEVKISKTSLGCSIVGNGDLYDWGFREEDIKLHGIEILINGISVRITD